MTALRLHISGMTCSACSARIERVLSRMPGIESVSVNLATAYAIIHYEPEQLSLIEIMDKIEQIGYMPSELQRQTSEGRADEARTARNRFLLSSAAAMPLLWSMLPHVPGLSAMPVPAVFMSTNVQWLLATWLVFYCGYPFYSGAYYALKQRSANMDVLVALSLSIAYFYSHYQLFRHQSALHGSYPVYFDAIAMIIAVVLLGKWLESIAKGKAIQALKDIDALQPEQVRITEPAGERWIAAEHVQAGDWVVVHPGERIGADGIVERGCSDVDESMLSGESKAMVRKKGDRVFSGTICCSGTLRIKVDTSYSMSRLSQIIVLAQGAQHDTPASIRKLDKVAAVFVPVMLACALATFLGWMYAADPANGLHHAMAVLLIACPCALGLAAPVSILTSTGQAARSGILFKQGSALEAAYRADIVLLDKTGTLTEGRPEVRAIYASDGSESQLLRLTAALGKHSLHPLAGAIVQAAERMKLLIPAAAQVEEQAGFGLKGVVEERNLIMGSAKWLHQHAIYMDEAQFPHIASGMDGTIVHLAVDGRWFGVIALDDRLKPDAAEAVRSLKRRYKVWIVTGDRSAPAERLAEQLGVDVCRSNVSPEGKLLLVRQLQSEGYRVAMIGDGLNDAAALTAADVGFAFGGNQVAAQAGDVVLLHTRLSAAVEAMGISRRTSVNIRQNLLLALLYNAAALPFAMLGFIHPGTACLLMSASSLAVVGNALRLRRSKPIAKGRL